MNETFYPIDWARIADAIAFYKRQGFEYIELPYFVTKDVSRVTTTLGIVYSPSVRFGMDLVGSAEQAFISLLNKGKLETHKKYVACTPCFRAEDKFDELHQLHFMKVELFIPLDTSEDDDKLQSLMDEIARPAFHFMEQAVSPHKDQLEIVSTPTGFDFELGGIEVGSYGARVTKKLGPTLSWMYGTGLAEPRMSQAIHKVWNMKDTDS